ncbi:CgeB family protein [Larkinella terrae]|uniref:Glycosyltransferase n=1 Tax=Larkinella terrae TaxID=2025311 RepID=A0A7K0EFV6_9BACT|nr:glycosyltransferase [Larkinella terrae]MRS60729.1 glycosyltransferase [Larkinella terrae]
MRILYIGDGNPFSTSFHRLSALRRLGYTVDVRNPYEAFKTSLEHFIFGKIHYRTGFRFLQNKVNSWLSEILAGGENFDIIWVDSGELFGKKCLQNLKTVGIPVILYNVDDPTGKRDGNRFKSLLEALPLYDLVVVVRQESERECIKLGAARVLWVYRSYDEEAHRPYRNVEEIPAQFRSDVAFIGTWIRYEKRDEFLLKLIELGVPVSIWGTRWQNSPNWHKLKPHHRGDGLGGRDYVAAIQGAKVCIGMLSKGNRDLHTQRSLEVPFAGGLFCAERTSEHEEMYREGVEAVFWSDAVECARVCKELLANDSLRENIRLAGMERVRSLKVGNEDACRTILETVFQTT